MTGKLGCSASVKPDGVSCIFISVVIILNRGVKGSVSCFLLVSDNLMQIYITNEAVPFVSLITFAEQ